MFCSVQKPSRSASSASTQAFHATIHQSRNGSRRDRSRPNWLKMRTKSPRQVPCPSLLPSLPMSLSMSLSMNPSMNPSMNITMNLSINLAMSMYQDLRSSRWLNQPMKKLQTWARLDSTVLTLLRLLQPQ